MNIRKLLYLPTEAQKKIIAADIKHILENCDKIANQEWKEQKENQKFHDEVCPKCKSRKEDIVDKIRQVIGDGKVSGSFSLGFGSVSGSMSVDTNEVNHCNKCGNEWKKFKIKYVNMTNILITTLNYLGDIFENPEHNKKLNWKMEAIQVFDGCSAEAIMVLVGKHSHNLRISTKRVVTIYRLRKHYKSVFDVKNKKELEKI